MKHRILLAGALLALGCNNEITGLGPPSDPATETFAASLGVNISQMTADPSGIYYLDVVPGSGDPVTVSADSVWVTYAGFLKDGKLFDSGINTPFATAEILPGLRIGLVGMKVGGRRRVVIPSALGYGGVSRRDPSTGKISIPRQSTLIFNVDLLQFHTPTPPASAQ